MVDKVVLNSKKTPNGIHVITVYDGYIYHYVSTFGDNLKSGFVV